MKFAAKILIAFLFLSLIQAQSFEKYFHDSTMRIDYHHTGDKTSEWVSVDKIYKYGTWAGSKKNLTDKFNNGRFYIKVYDAADKSLIYSKGFDSYFGEYQMSGPAAKGIKKAFHETALIPYPKNKVKFVVEKRDDKKELYKIFETEIDPSSIDIIRMNFEEKDILVYKSHVSGNPHTSMDLAIIGDGYSSNDVEKFKSDIDRFTKLMLKTEPYVHFQGKINIYGVLKPSSESGIDEPRADIYKNTSLSSTFNSMGSERYLLTEDNKALRDVAANVPYDAVAIMVNHHRYGGGGIYNFYCTFTTDNQFADYLFLHEFGHSFTGLADEYYTSSTAYNEMFKLDIEPLEPNITALLDKDNLKWKKLVTKGLSLPTKWEKEAYDKKSYEWTKERAKLNSKVAELKRNKASKEEIEAAEKLYAEKDAENSKWVDEYLQNCKHFGKVGAFEGAGYLQFGMYRPELDCIMFSKGVKPFCKVCQSAIAKVIKSYTE